MHILSVAEAIEEFDVDMYFVLIENIVVNDSRKHSGCPSNLGKVKISRRKKRLLRIACKAR